MADIALQLKQLSHHYDGVVGVDVLRGIDFTLRKGEMAALIGPSGSGKSTLLQLAGLLDTPTSGEVWIGGQNATGLNEHARTMLRRRSIGFVFQFHHLLAEFTALENMLMPLKIAGMLNKQAKDRVLHLAEKVGLTPRLHHRPAELSGGERQRVAMVRALAHKPVLLLADEPTGNLDEANASALFALLTQLAKDESTAMLIATHHTGLAAKLQRVVQLKQGALVQAVLSNG